MAFNPEVFRWARESAGLSLEQAAKALSIVPASLDAIEAGQKVPSRTALSNMAKTYHRSLLTFYLPAPPRKGDRGEDFRTVVAQRTIEADADVDALLRDLRARHSLVRTILEEDDDVKPLPFVGSAHLADGAQALCRSIEQMLGITRVEYRQQRDAESAFSLLRECAEDAGVFVLLIGNLGSHHSAIPVEAFRGFAIADRIAPFIVINDGDAKAAWSFTLLHELAHLWLGTTGVSGGGAPDSAIERFCNEVAGEFLLPRADARTGSRRTNCQDFGECESLARESTDGGLRFVEGWPRDPGRLEIAGSNHPRAAGGRAKAREGTRKKFDVDRPKLLRRPASPLGASHALFRASLHRFRCSIAVEGREGTGRQAT
jgi:Zn-dependent peptidase ImmA (M78 family)/transcriptional regulator with XRE-family HTH domain